MGWRLPQYGTGIGLQAGGLLFYQEEAGWELVPLGANTQPIRSPLTICYSVSVLEGSLKGKSMENAYVLQICAAYFFFILP